MVTLEQEAVIVCRYLTGRVPGDKVVALYCQAHNRLPLQLSAKEAATWQHCLSSPFVMGCVESALAIKNPRSGIRHKITLMLAILESAPAFHAYFLPQQRSAFYLFKLFFTGIKAVLKTMNGYLLLLFI
jgi:hypothetical protein